MWAAQMKMARKTGHCVYYVAAYKFMFKAACKILIRTAKLTERCYDQGFASWPYQSGKYHLSCDLRCALVAKHQPLKLSCCLSHYQSDVRDSCNP